MKTNSLFKRLVSMLIVVLMICTLFPVTALAQPAKPTYDDLKLLLKVEIDCETEKNDKDIHDEITYDLLDNSEGLKPSFSVGEVKGESCTVTVFSDRYIDKYNEDTKVIHSPEDDDDISETVTLKYENNKWELDDDDDDDDDEIKFEVECDGIPTPPTKPGDDTVKGLLANSAVKIDCTNSYAVGHADRTYGLLAGSYNVSDPTLSGDKYTCTVTVNPASYVAEYNNAFNGHSLSSAEQGSKTITLKHNGTGWVVDSTVPVVFTVDCNTPAPAVTDITKEVMTSAPQGVTIPEGTTITYPTNNSVTVPYGTTSVTLLYKVTVYGDAGASYSVTDEGATCISNPANGTIPQGEEEAVLYFTKTFDLTGVENTCSNTAAVEGTNFSATATVTVKVSAPDAPSYDELKGLLNVKIDCVNTKVSHEDKTYGLIANSEGVASYSIGTVQQDKETGVYTCVITVYAAPYVAKYSTDMNKEHSLSDNSPKTITLIYSGNKWIVPVVALAEGDAITGLVTFNVVCEETPVTTYTVTYKDGVGGKVFADQSYSDLSYGDATPLFQGSLARKGYVFAGWTPAVSGTVTGNATYVATWRKVNDTVVIEIGGGNSSSGGEENPNTGAPVFVGVAIGALAAAK